MNTQRYTYTLEQCTKIAMKLFQETKDDQVITFTGPLGAGKTTLIQELCRCYGVTELVTSPTFTYLNIYKTPMFDIYHFDLYRLSSIDDFMAAGFDEYLYQPQSKVLIEWPAIIMQLLTEAVCHVNLDYDPLQPEARIITITHDRNE